MRAMRGTISCWCKRATRTALSAVALATSVAPFLPSALAGSDNPREAAGGAGPETNDVEVQRQVNELRGDLLDERERRIGRRMEAHGAGLRGSAEITS